MGGYGQAMRRYAVFTGRASRAEFWQFIGVFLLIFFVALMIDGAIVQQAQLDDSKEPGGIVAAIVLFAHLLPYLAVLIRRLHDTNRTGWLVLLNFIPPLNLLLAVFMCLRGTPGPNRFGPDPLDAASVGDSAHLPAPVAPAAGGAATATPAARASQGRPDLIAELERLGRLRKDGHLSEAEFEVMKAEVLAQGRSA